MGDLVFLPDVPVASASDYESSLSSASSFSCAGSHSEFECRWCCTNKTTNRCRGSRWFGGGAEDCCGRAAADFCDDGECCGAGIPARCALDRTAHGTCHSSGRYNNQFYIDLRPRKKRPWWKYGGNRSAECCCEDTSTRWKWWRRRRRKTWPTSRRRRRRDKKYVQNNHYYDMRDRDGRFSEGSDEDEYEGDDEEVRRSRPVRRPRLAPKMTFARRGSRRERVRTERNERPRVERGHGRMKRIHKRSVDRTRKRSIEIEAMLSDSDFSENEDSGGEESEREESREKDRVIEELREEVRRLRNLSREESDELGERRRSRRALRESWAGRTRHSI